jgi:site-specific DNA-cytosine methylase
VKDLEAKGFVKPKTWQVVTSATMPAPQDDERVIIIALVERGDFFVEHLTKYSFSLTTFRSTPTHTL